MTKKLTAIAALCGALLCAGASEKPQLRILAIADIQYADKEAHGTRFYRNSLPKLERIREAVKGEKLDFLVHLGDIVDSKYANLAAPLGQLKKFPLKQYHVMGNHDFADTEENVAKIREELGLKDPAYYYFDMGAWRFIAVDSNRLGSYYKPKNPELKKQGEAAKKKIEEAGGNWGKSWNGGIDKEQFEWLDALLKKTQEDGKSAVLFAHGQIRPANSHICLNSDEIIELLSRHKCVKAWLNGHNHRGGYELTGGVHYLTISGLVETEDTLSYAIAELYPDRIEIIGHGKTPSRTLPLN